MKNGNKCCKVTDTLCSAGMAVCLLMLTSCGRGKPEEQQFNRSMDELNKYKGDAARESITREQAKAEIEAARKGTEGQEVETMSMEELKKLSESQKK